MTSVTALARDHIGPPVGKRIVIIDETAPGGTTATGSLKETFFQGIERERLLVIHDTKRRGRVTMHAGLKPHFATTRTYRSIERPLAIIKAFRPDVVLYRPLPTSPLLHRLACKLAFDADLPIALWFMDDWPERLRAVDPPTADAMDRDLRQLACQSVACFAISEAMGLEFARRYGGPEYMIARNGIVPEDWAFASRPKPARSELLLRYSGSLAPDMSLSSMVCLAREISDLNSRGQAVRLEIRTQRHWLNQFGHMFKNLAGVSIQSTKASPEQYRAWIADADIGVVAYNFDDETVRYTRYSFANKVPELIASGVAILAIGPTSIETIRYLQNHKIAATATKLEHISPVLHDLCNHPHNRAALAEEAAHHLPAVSLEGMRQDMDRFLSGTSAADDNGSDAVSLLQDAPPNVAWRTTAAALSTFRNATLGILSPLLRRKKKWQVT